MYLLYNLISPLKKCLKMETRSFSHKRGSWSGALFCLSTFLAYYLSVDINGGVTIWLTPSPTITLGGGGVIQYHPPHFFQLTLIQLEILQLLNDSSAFYFNTFFGHLSIILIEVLPFCAKCLWCHHKPNFFWWQKDSFTKKGNISMEAIDKCPKKVLK